MLGHRRYMVVRVATRRCPGLGGTARRSSATHGITARQASSRVTRSNGHRCAPVRNHGLRTCGPSFDCSQRVDSSEHPRLQTIGLHRGLVGSFGELHLWFSGWDRSVSLRLAVALSPVVSGLTWRCTGLGAATCCVGRVRYHSPQTCRRGKLSTGSDHRGRSWRWSTTFRTDRVWLGNRASA